MLIGYTRLATEDHSLEIQRDALVEAGVDLYRIYEENLLGVKTKRPQLEECLKALREDDVLVVYRLDRLGRSLSELIEITNKLSDRGIGLRSLIEQIDTTTAGGLLVFHVFGAVAQFERDLISERTKAGLEAARARGHGGGRPPKLKPNDVRMIRQLVKDTTLTKQDIADRFGVSRATIHRELGKDRKNQESVDLRQATKVSKVESE